MKNLPFFLLGALAATVFWFFMGYLQVDGDKMDKLLHHNEVVTEEAVEMVEPAVGTLATEEPTVQSKTQPKANPETKPTVPTVSEPVSEPAKQPKSQPTSQPKKQAAAQPAKQSSSQSANHSTSQSDAKTASQPVAKEQQTASQPSIVGRWRIADPVGSDERERMLQIDEYGNIKDFYSVSYGLSRDYAYLVEGNIIKYGLSSRYYNNSFQFKVRSENGKDYLEIYNDTNFGGKWVSIIQGKN
ncbi:MAG: hypothetical protein MJZ94_05265 [Bacteroidales bacterium]|nr:hypothetical protein [Bacteroidales bacterium]